MQSRVFDHPVTILVGMGFPRQICSVVEAYQFLTDWGGNSPEHRAALRACKAALVGDIEPETARGVFVAFAEKKDLVAPEFSVGSSQPSVRRFEGPRPLGIPSPFPVRAAHVSS